LSEEQKFNYLYKSLPKEIIPETNLEMHLNKWEYCKECLQRLVPRLRFLNSTLINNKTMPQNTMLLQNIIKEIIKSKGLTIITKENLTVNIIIKTITKRIEI